MLPRRNVLNAIRKVPSVATDYFRCLSSTAKPLAQAPLSHEVLRKKLKEYAGKRTTNPTVKALIKSMSSVDIKTGEFHGMSELNRRELIRKSSMFLHSELPTRIAKGVLGIESVENLRDMPSTKEVLSCYTETFEEFMTAAPLPDSEAAEQQFSEVVQSMYERHRDTVFNMAKGVYELRVSLEDPYGKMPGETGTTETFENMQNIHPFLDSFYARRLGFRTYSGHYLALRRLKPKHGYVGLIKMNTLPIEVAEMAAEDADYLCIRTHGEAPEVTFHGCLDLHLPYIESHLSYILLELLKNSMRATVEHHRIKMKRTGPLPEVKVVIADGENNEDVTIKISDEGGGIKRSHMHRIWNYLFTTADPNIQGQMFKPGSSNFSPLAGLGYGLPLARAHARLFGGDLSILSMEGFGTDAFVHLRRISQ